MLRFGVLSLCVATLFSSSSAYAELQLTRLVQYEGLEIFRRNSCGELMELYVKAPDVSWYQGEHAKLNKAISAAFSTLQFECEGTDVRKIFIEGFAVPTEALIVYDAKFEKKDNGVLQMVSQRETALPAVHKTKASAPAYHEQAVVEDEPEEEAPKPVAKKSPKKHKNTDASVQLTGFNEPELLEAIVNGDFKSIPQDRDTKCYIAAVAKGVMGSCDKSTVAGFSRAFLKYCPPPMMEKYGNSPTGGFEAMGEMLSVFMGDPNDRNPPTMNDMMDRQAAWEEKQAYLPQSGVMDGETFVSINKYTCSGAESNMLWKNLQRMIMKR